MSWLSKALGLSNPAGAAMPYLDQIPGVGRQYYDPFINRGQQAGDTLEGEYGKLLNPTEFLNHLTESYKPSEEYKYKQQELHKGLSAAAGQGGYAGTPYAINQTAESTNQALSHDMQQYLQNALGIYNQGLTGQQDFYNKGFGASGALADLIGGSLNQKGGAAFQGAAQQNEQRSALLSALSQLLGGGIAFGSQPTGSLFGHNLWG